MISWALRRNSEGAKDAPGPDDTQIEQPDTPAPVFAVRALRTALFGTPAPREAWTQEAAEVETSEPTDSASLDQKSPVKPAGILLTPGTGTSRRKRVSFGEGVKEGVAVNKNSVSGIPDEFPGKFPSPWHGNSDDEPGARRKTRLTEAMENARRNKEGGTSKAAQLESDEWEEYDDDCEMDGDVTVDLNEPHSRSGKYWKAHFETYHEDAKAEMEKLVKYKQLAKSYAKKKDTEAIDLNQKLKEEQEKVKVMEQKVSEMARRVSSKVGKNGVEYDSKMMSDLAKQTALAVHYKEQVEELEALLSKGEQPSGETDMLSRRTSPRTHKTLVETQKELRKARSQIRELDRVKNERNRLQSELKFAEQRATRLAEENKKLAAEFPQPKVEEASKISELERELARAKADITRQDRELSELRAEHDELKINAKLRYREAELVVKKKDERIAELKREISSLRREQGAHKPASTIPSEDMNLRARPVLASTESEENTTEVVQKQLTWLRRRSMERGLIATPPSDRKTREREPFGEIRRNSLLGGTQSPSPRPRASASEATRAQAQQPTVLGERENLQEPRRVPSMSRMQSRKADALEKLNALSAHINSTNAAPAARTVSEHHRIRPSRTYIHELPRPLSLPAALENEPPKADLVRDTFERLGAAHDEINSSGIWDINASKTTLPEGRRAAAIARLQRKRAERALELATERNKENQRPSMA